jgi:hypothetical protein
LTEIITAVLDAGLRLTAFVEHDSVPWEAIPGRMVVDDAGEWRLNAQPERLAASYTLQAAKTVGVVNSTGGTSQATCDVGTVEFTTRLSPVVGDVRRA